MVIKMMHVFEGYEDNFRKIHTYRLQQ